MLPEVVTQVPDVHDNPLAQGPVPVPIVLFCPPVLELPPLGVLPPVVAPPTPPGLPPAPSAPPVPFPTELSVSLAEQATALQKSTIPKPKIHNRRSGVRMMPPKNSGDEFTSAAEGYQPKSRRLGRCLQMLSAGAWQTTDSHVNLQSIIHSCKICVWFGFVECCLRSTHCGCLRPRGCRRRGVKMCDLIRVETPLISTIPWCLAAI